MDVSRLAASESGRCAVAACHFIGTIGIKMLVIKVIPN